MSTVRARDGVPEGGPLVKWPKTPASHAGNSGSNPLRVTMIYQVAKELWIFRSEQSVSLAMRVHPFPSRTRQLSSSVLTILGWKRPGKIRRCRHLKPLRGNFKRQIIFKAKEKRKGKHALIAQSVEHAAVNRGVAGSSPAGGAILSATWFAKFLYMTHGNRAWAFSSVG